MWNILSILYPDSPLRCRWLNVLNEGVFTVVFALFAGKSYSIFALLFGLPFIYIRTSRRREKDFGYRFLWRLLLLTIRYVERRFYPAGDVLLLYAIVGVVCLSCVNGAIRLS